MSKRKRPDTTSSLLSGQEETLLNLIKKKEDMGIWSQDMKKEANLPNNIFTKSLKTLLTKKLIKEVPNVQFKGKKFYMAVEFEPTSEVTGGAWYSEGSLDTDFINLLKYRCAFHISKRKFATINDVTEDIAKSNLFKGEYNSEKVGEILRTLVLDNEVMEVKSTGVGEFASIKAGTVCYRCKKQQGGAAKPPRVAPMASIPCGDCPRINECTPDGIISPMTCQYYTEWLEF